MADPQVYGIEITLDRSSNPKIYYLFDRPEIGRAVRAFLKDHDLRIVASAVRGSEGDSNPTQIKLEVTESAKGPITWMPIALSKMVLPETEPAPDSMPMYPPRMEFPIILSMPQG